MNSSKHYSEHFANPAITAGYARKFDNAIDQLRHQIECHILAQYARGALFDCSVGSGRLVGLLPKVESYSGMDYSRPFLDHVRAQFPGIDVQWGDLTQGIERPDNSFDTVISLRTIFALGDPARILAEMVRVAKPGGLIIFDYGTRPQQVQFGGHFLDVSGGNIQGHLAELPVRIIQMIKLDSLLLKLKRSRPGRLLARIVVRSGVARAMLIGMEQRAALRTAERQLFIIEKV